jgi:hypothetical protein
MTSRPGAEILLLEIGAPESRRLLDRPARAAAAVLGRTHPGLPSVQRRMTLWSAWACRIDGRGLLSGVADGERQDELGEAPEERQEAHPEQDQVGPLGQGIHPIRPRHPERQQDQQDPGDQLEPPVGIRRPGGHALDDLEAAVEDQDQPQDRGEGEEGVDPAG